MKHTVLIFLTLAAVVGVLFVDPIPQDPGYHRFADARTVMAIPNFWNVVSNLPFLLVGAAGLWFLRSGEQDGVLDELVPAYRILFAGVCLTAFGSAWYHLAPDNARLVWDRLPMTLGFMGLFAAVIGEHLSPSLGRRILLPLVLAGGASVIYWHLTEAQGAGDLRPYALVQFLPLLLIPAMLIVYRSAFDRVGFIWAMVAVYGLSKLFEHFDAAVLAATQMLSGHSVKHLVAAAATLVFLHGMTARRLTNNSPVGTGSRRRH